MSNLTGTITGNAIAMFVQAILTSVILFLLYLFISRLLGLSALGIWSVVMATTSASRLIDIGFSGGITKFVAKYLEKKDFIKVKKIVDSSALIIGLILILFLPIIYPVFKLILSLIFSSEELNLAYEILPISMACIYINSFVSVYQGTIDGHERMDLTVTSQILGQLFFISVVFLIVPQYGLLGLAMAQLFQSIFVFSLSRFFAGYLLKELKLFKMNFSFDVIKEMWRYGLNIQLSSFLQLLQEPISKGFVAYFGGSAVAGIYEVAYQIIFRLRSLLINVNYAIVPTVARITEKENEDTDRIYLNNFNLIYLWGIFIFSSATILSGGIGWVLFGFYEHQLILMLFILSFGYFGNLLSAPAYLLYVGDGRVKRNTQIHLLISSSNIILSFILGVLFSWEGVVLGFSISLWIGTLWFLYNFRYQNEKSKFTLTFFDCLIFLISTFFALYSWFFPIDPSGGRVELYFLNFLFPIILLFLTLSHPINKTIMGILFNIFKFKKKLD